MKEIEMKFKIQDIKPNPFRNIENYPINREKVEELKRSMDRTDYWGNILGRLVDGQPEIAYGHHRRVALLEKFGDSHMVDIIIRDLHDDDMIQIMAAENMDAWASKAIVDIETVHAVVKAFAEGKIQLQKPEYNMRKSDTRYAPSFIPGEQNTMSVVLPYTAHTVGEFLGWVYKSGAASNKIDACLAALQYAEEGILDLSIFEKLSTSQLGAVIDEARNARKALETQAKLAEKEAAEAARQEAAEHEREIKAASQFETQEARKAKLRAAKRREHAELAAIEKRNQSREVATTVARHLSRGMQKGEIATKNASAEAYKLRPKSDTVPPRIEEALRKVLKKIGSYLADDRDDIVAPLAEIITYKKHLSASTRADAAATLTALAKRANAFAKQFENAPHVELE